MIETITLPALTVVGILVEAHWNELPKAVPAAWTRLFDSGLAPEAGGVRDGFVEVIAQDQLDRHPVRRPVAVVDGRH